MLSGILMTTAFAWTGSNPNLPTTEVIINQAPPAPWSYPFATTIVSGVPVAIPPYDVSNGGVYTGWCIDLGHNVVRGVNYPVVLYSSLGVGLPAPFGSFPWDMINYVLNHKQGTGVDISQAIWFFVDGVDWADTAAKLAADGYPIANGPVPSTLAAAMVTDALANGVGFVPGPGEVVAVICAPTNEAIQDTIIELTIPSEKAPGLTPGFWKNNLAVYLGYAKGNRGYSDPTGADPTIVTKETMADFFATFSPATLQQLYTDLTTMGNNAAIRDAAANVFNVAAGLSTGPPWN
jgi:hypothetical protein